MLKGKIFRFRARDLCPRQGMVEGKGFGFSARDFGWLAVIALPWQKKWFAEKVATIDNLAIFGIQGFRRKVLNLNR